MTLVKDRPATVRKATGKTGLTGKLIGFALLVAAFWAALLAVASPVSTDVPVLVSTSPGVNSTARPDNVVLTFDRPVNAALATVRMMDPYHREVDPGRPGHADGRPNTVSVPIPKVKYAGTYTVAWSLSTEQLGSVTGTFTYDLASRSPAQTAPQIATKPSIVVTVFYAVAQFGALAALALLVGAVFFVAVIWPSGAESETTRRLVTYSWVGATGFTVASLLTFGPYAAKLPLTDTFKLLRGTFESDFGATFLARLLVLALAGLTLAQFMSCAPAESKRDRWLRGAAVLGCAATGAATWAFSGHGVLDSPAPLSLAVDTVHLTAMAVLAGGLVMLRGPLVRGRDRTTVRIAALRFSRITLVCAGLIVVTSGYEVWQQVGGVAAVRTFPGWVWVAKLALAVVLVGAGVAALWWVRRRFLRPEPADKDEQRTDDRAIGRFRRLTMAVAAVAGLVVVATALLVISQPARVAHAQSAVTRELEPSRLEYDTISGDASGVAAEGWLDLVATPDKVGENQVHVTVLDKTGAIAVDGVTVTAVLNSPNQSGKSLPVPLARTETGHFAGSVTVPSPGQWELGLTVHTAAGKEQTIYGVVSVSA